MSKYTEVVILKPRSYRNRLSWRDCGSWVER